MKERRGEGGARVRPQDFQIVDIVNNWGRLSFSAGGRGLSLSGMRVMVQFPDGATEEMEIVTVAEESTVHDQGRTTNVTNRVPYIMFDWHGLSMKARVDGRLKVAFLD